MDVKPSNVLLAGDGQPMLLDFHLARSPIGPDGPPPAWMGGTPGVHVAGAAAGRWRPCARAGRSATRSTAVPTSTRWACCCTSRSAGPCRSRATRRCRRSIAATRGSPSGLSDIIHKCLCRDPRDRYPDAAALATDLRRHLADLPLRGVPNRSWAERWRKWRRRRPSALSRGGLIVLILAAAVGAPAATLGIAYRQRRDDVEAALAQGRGAPRQPSVRRGGRRSAAGPGAGRASARVRPAEARAAPRSSTWRRRAARSTSSTTSPRCIRFRYGLSPPPAEEAPR